MRLYSVQPLAVWNALCEGRVVTARPFDAAQEDGGTQEPSWRSAYEWLSSQMRSRDVAPLYNHPLPAFPMWAWYWYNGPRHARPDLRDSGMRSWAASRRMVLLELDIDDARVLLSDYDGWHWCLNYWYLDRARKSAAFEREVTKALGTSYFTTQPLPSPDFDARLRESWNTMFDLKAMLPILECPKKRQTVQATFWHLGAHDVVGATEFGMGQRCRALDLSDLSPPSKSTLPSTVLQEAP